MENSNNLTDRERELLHYIRSTIREKGYAPSVRDICNALDIRSTSTVHSYLLRLEEKGAITRAPGKSRTLRLPDQSAARAVAVPILGKVAAGEPILAVENFQGYIEVPLLRSGTDPDELFALTVRGDSMIEAGILSGDLVVAQHCDTAEVGDIVVALIDGEATVKTLARDGDRYYLMPANSKLEPIYPDELNIIGKLHMSLRTYYEN